MPSVRVREQRYATISEDFARPERPRTIRPLTSLFQSPDNPHPSEENLSEGPDHGTNSRQARTARASRRPTLRKPLSKIYHHCTTRPHNIRHRPTLLTPEEYPASSEALQSSSLEPRLSLQDGRMAGSQADVMVRGEQPGAMESSSSLALSHTGSAIQAQLPTRTEHGEHLDDIVEHLDCIDPQVSTVATLANTANAILIPPLSFYSRKPMVVLSSPASAPSADVEKGRNTEKDTDDALDRHVDDVLNNPSKIRRTMMGVWSFVKTPMGVITAIYGFLVVFWGAAIVLFLAKIINLHNENTQGFWVEVSSQVTNGLFTVTGIGLIPSRVLDTYRVYKIWYYKRRVRRLRAKAGLPPLFDEDDLPDPAYDPNYVHVLTEKEQADLHRQQGQFQYHQTWYRAHGTATHRAFPINTALIICLLNDGNSIFQIMLCATMWSMNRFQRPAWSTGTLIPASFLCGIGSAIFIWRGGQKTKRTEEVAERLRAALAMEHPDATTEDLNSYNDTTVSNGHWKQPLAGNDTTSNLEKSKQGQQENAEGSSETHSTVKEPFSKSPEEVPAKPTASRRSTLEGTHVEETMVVPMALNTLDEKNEI